MRYQTYFILSLLAASNLIHADPMVFNANNLGTSQVYNPNTQNTSTSLNRVYVTTPTNSNSVVNSLSTTNTTSSTQQTFPPLGSQQATFPPLGSTSSNASANPTTATPIATVAATPAVVSPSSTAPTNSTQTTSLGNYIANQCVVIGQTVNLGQCGKISIGSLNNNNTWFKFPQIVNIGTASGPDDTDTIIVFYQTSTRGGVCVTYAIPPDSTAPNSYYIQQAARQAFDGQPDGAGSGPNDGIKVTGKLIVTNPPYLSFCAPN